MIKKELIEKALFWHSKDEYLEKDDFKICKIEQKESSLIFSMDDADFGLKADWNIYELGILLKEYIEDYAKSISLKGVWIDLNDLSKDETYYFKHCNEVFEGISQYELIMETEQ